MKLFKILVLALLLTGCANTDEVDDSDVHEDIANSQGQSSEDNEDSEDGGEEASSTSSSRSSGIKPPHEVSGERAALLYDIASAALKKTDSTLTYSVTCKYTIKPLVVKGCMVKTGFLPGDAKNKIGRLLVEAKNLPRKKTAANEASITANYTCVKGRLAEETSCSLDRD